jgi:Outer membrane protein beta-barrel domain
MKLRLLATVVALALTTVAARAQVGLYVNPVGIRVSNSTADFGPFAFLGSGKTSQMFYGANIGGYWDFYHSGNVEAGVDIRDSITHGNSASLNSFNLGARIAAAPFTFPLKVYVQPYVGAGKTRAPTTSVTVTRANYGINVGADYKVHPHIDIRVFEIGYSSLQTASSETIGGSSSNIPSARLLSLSVGLVFRVH